MATLTKTWVFLADAEGLADAGNSASLAFAWLASDGRPANGCANFTQTTKNTTQTEYARKVATTDTWETWGIPAGSTISQVQVTGWSDRLAANTKLSSHSIIIKIVNSSGTTVHSAGTLITASPSISTFAFTDESAGTARAVDAAYQASTTPVRLWLEYTCATSNSSAGSAVDYRLDSIAVTITYTTSVTVGITGNALTASKGTLAVAGSANVSPTGSSLTVAVGTVTITISVSVVVSPTGNALTLALGTPVVTGAANVTPTGSALAVAPGTLGVTGGAMLTLTGIPATLAIGNPTIRGDANVAASGNQLASNVGTISITGDANVSVTGNEIVISVGDPTIQGDATVIAVGVELASAAGDLAVTGDANISALGNELTAVLGAVSISGDANVSVIGNEITITVGNVTVVIVNPSGKKCQIINIS